VIIKFVITFQWQINESVDTESFQDNNPTCRIQIAAWKLEQGEHKECKRLLDDGKNTLDSMTDTDPFVYASHHWVSSQYHKLLCT